MILYVLHIYLDKMLNEDEITVHHVIGLQFIM